MTTANNIITESQGAKADHVSTAVAAAATCSPPINKHTTHTSPTQRKCRYGSHCRYRETTCRLWHPSPIAASSRGETGSIVVANQNIKKNQVCRHGINCWSKHCQRQHPPGWDPAVNNHNKSSSPNKFNDKRSPNNKNNKSPRSKTAKPKDHELDPGFYRGPLRPADAQGYKAAGMLLMRQYRPDGIPSFFEATATVNGSETLSPPTTTTTKRQVLLCAEIRKKNKKKQVNGTLELNLLGGKIENDDNRDSRHTAAREFWEETGRIVSLDDCRALLENNGNNKTKATTLWCGPGKYVLFVVELDAASNTNSHNNVWRELPSKYHELCQSGTKPDGAEPDFLVWVDWHDLLLQANTKRQSNTAKASPAAKNHNPSGTTVTFSIPPGGTDNNNNNNAAEKHVTLGLSRFTKSLLSDTIFQNLLNDTTTNMEDDTAMQDVSTGLEALKVGEISLITTNKT